MTTIRVGICVLVAFAVLAHGAVEPWSEALLEIGAATLFAVWGILALREQEIEIRWTWLYLPLLGLGAFALLQQVSGLSAYPYITKIELLKWGAYLLLLFLAAESFHTAEEFERLAWFLVSLGFFVSLLGIVQHFTFNGKLYWFRVLHQGGAPFGPFVNYNHFAGFVELIVPLGLAMFFCGAVRRDKLPLLSLLTIVPISALFVSGSRGGITSFFFEAALLGFLVRVPKQGKKRLLQVVGLALVAGVLAAWLGVGSTVEKFESSTPGEVSRDRRISMFKDTWQIFLHHPWTGTGLGTLETVFPRYETYYDGLVVDHAHNDYLELLADTGAVGGVCLLGFLALLFQRGLYNLRSAKNSVGRSFYAGALFACAGLLLHSLVDFNMHIPSNALLFLLLAGLATSGMAKAEADQP